MKGSGGDKTERKGGRRGRGRLPGGLRGWILALAWMALWLLSSLPAPSHADIDAKRAAEGLRAALDVGVEKVVAHLGRPDGFWQDEEVRIPLPEALSPVQDLLDKNSLGGLTEQVREKINRAAEAAVPLGKEALVKAVEEVTFKDAIDILRGEGKTATQIMRSLTEEHLRQAFRPVVEQQIESVGALAAYQELVDRARGLALLAATRIDVDDFDLVDYVTERAIEGVFTKLAAEEALIRSDPKARITDLLEDVFGAAGGG